MLVLKPRGRGNSSVLRMRLDGDRAQPLLFRVGETITLAGINYRICEVTA